jgi:hypothetical protein
MFCIPKPLKDTTLRKNIPGIMKKENILNLFKNGKKRLIITFFSNNFDMEFFFCAYLSLGKYLQMYANFPDSDVSEDITGFTAIFPLIFLACSVK